MPCIRAAAFFAFLAFTSSAFADRFMYESVQGPSPLNVSLSGGANHARFAVDRPDEFKSFSAFVSSLNGSDDDDRDGRGDLRAPPEWVAYEPARLVEKGGQFAEPDISIERPGDWYKSPKFFLYGLPAQTFAGAASTTAHPDRR